MASPRVLLGPKHEGAKGVRKVLKIDEALERRAFVNGNSAGAFTSCLGQSLPV